MDMYNSTTATPRLRTCDTEMQQVEEPILKFIQLSRLGERRLNEITLTIAFLVWEE